MRKRATCCQSRRNMHPVSMSTLWGACLPVFPCGWTSDYIIPSVHQCFLTSAPLSRQQASNCSPTPHHNNIVLWQKRGLFPDVHSCLSAFVLCKASRYRKTKVRAALLCTDNQHSRGETVLLFTFGQSALSPLTLCPSEVDYRVPSFLPLGYMVNVNVSESEADKCVGGKQNTALFISNACWACEEDHEKVVCTQIKALIHYWFHLRIRSNSRVILQIITIIEFLLCSLQLPLLGPIPVNCWESKFHIMTAESTDCCWFISFNCWLCSYLLCI